MNHSQMFKKFKSGDTVRRVVIPKISNPNFFSQKKSYFTSEGKIFSDLQVFGRNFFAGFAERGEPPGDFDFESDDA